MKIRTTYELDKSIDHDIAWRKREFTTIKFMILEARDHEKKILLRAAITLLYSHWEGHIKHCALVYLNYLNCLGLKYGQMKENFLLLSLTNEFSSGFSIKKFSSQKKLHEYFKTSNTINFSINEQEIIDTGSNLKYPVVSNILDQLGLDAKLYELKEHFIDSKLLRCRNAIAHGDIISSQEIEDTYAEIESELLTMIQSFQNAIRTAVDNKEYLK